MAATCLNCGTCTCTGTTLVKASNGNDACTNCITIVELEIKRKASYKTKQ